MEMTIPFALGWGAVLTGVTAGVRLYNKKKEAQAQAASRRESGGDTMKLNLTIQPTSSALARWSFVLLALDGNCLCRRHGPLCLSGSAPSAT